MGCVFAEGDSLALFTALRNSLRNVISRLRTCYSSNVICRNVKWQGGHCQQLTKLIKSVTSSVLKSNYYSRLFLRKRRLKNKPGTAQVGSPLKFRKRNVLKDAKDNIVKDLLISQCRKIPQKIHIRLWNHIFPQLETQKIHFLKKIDF